MIERLLALDAELFLLLNAKLTDPILDRVMPAITTQENWYPFLGVAAVAMIIWGGRKGRLAVIMLIVGIALTDQITCSVLKPLVGRIRPCNVFGADEFRLLVNLTKSPAFPSGHAANSFGMATVASWRFRKFAPVFYLIAAAVAYSRVYVGVHYPLDVIAGAAVGIALGLTTIIGVQVVARIVKKALVASRAGRAGEARDAGAS
jgi:undecaprenyl-diphosphatase